MSVQSVIKNKSDFQAIVKKYKTIGKILERATKDTTDDNLPGYLGHALSELNSLVNDINNKVVSRKKQGLFKRILSLTIDRDQIDCWEKDIDSALKLFDTETIIGIAMRLDELVLRIDGNSTSVNVLKYQPIEPPSRPSMFYGRDDLVAELTALVAWERVLLPKSSFTSHLSSKKIADRRFFMAYDGLDPSTITFETFTTRFAGALGIELAGADPMRQISALLRFASALVVLDNAETFEEASGSSALGEIPPAIADIANIPGVVLILTSRSRRHAPNCSFKFINMPVVARLGKTYGTYSRNWNSTPPSINLLANAAQQNSWSPAILLKRWNNRHSKVLDPGKGKLQSLSDTMQLSLSSPSIQDLGDDGHRLLIIIAFLSQGLNDTLSSNLLPSLPQVDIICDVLCRESLVYRQDSFIKLLAPILHYVRDSLQAPDSTCLREIRNFYYRIVDCCLEEHDHYADAITSDHLNIEHVVAFNLAYVPDVIEEDVSWTRTPAWVELTSPSIHHNHASFWSLASFVFAETCSKSLKLSLTNCFSPQH
ncbi:hypothetical protein C8R48DRAFT_836558 [Suillus tomentosus]|nr:hypothetical protein C8R48DRAFT_836558 [Suillus tomentosus]